jgi:ribosomal protein S18 acetylase RimI-like enzyme
MKEFQLTEGKSSDREWLYDLYKMTMLPFIEATWGWDEEFQNNGFNKYLKPADWKIITVDNEKVGGFVLVKKHDHYWLEMLIIKSEYQKKGIGSMVVSYIQSIAVNKSLPLKLSVIKANPVKTFYMKLGFIQYDEDVSFYKLQWNL